MHASFTFELVGIYYKTIFNCKLNIQHTREQETISYGKSRKIHDFRAYDILVVVI